MIPCHYSTAAKHWIPDVSSVTDTLCEQSACTVNVEAKRYILLSVSESAVHAPSIFHIMSLLLLLLSLSSHVISSSLSRVRPHPHVHQTYFFLSHWVLDQGHCIVQITASITPLSRRSNNARDALSYPALCSRKPALSWRTDSWHTLCHLATLSTSTQ
jgi:hypothetical protein